jgi:hypothetical protein
MLFLKALYFQVWKGCVKLKWLKEGNHRRQKVNLSSESFNQKKEKAGSFLNTTLVTKRRNIG